MNSCKNVARQLAIQENMPANGITDGVSLGRVIHTCIRAFIRKSGFPREADKSELEK